MPDATPPAVKARLDKIMNDPLLDSLYSRWQDEAEYEDIREYGKAIAKALDCEVTRCKKRPMGFVLKFAEAPGAQYELQMTARANRWRRLS